MMNENSATQVVPDDKLPLLTKKTGLDGDNLVMLQESANRLGLDPFTNQIYGIVLKGKLSIQTGIDGLTTIADRSGKLAGFDDDAFCGPDGAWTDVWTSDEPPYAARSGVYKAGSTIPTRAVARWDEYKSDVGGMWKKYPTIMLAKCARALALRRIFPAELSGVYSTEEMARVAKPTPVEAVRPPLPSGTVKVSPSAVAPAVAALGEARSPTGEGGGGGVLSGRPTPPPPSKPDGDIEKRKKLYATIGIKVRDILEGDADAKRAVVGYVTEGRANSGTDCTEDELRGISRALDDIERGALKLDYDADGKPTVVMGESPP